MAKKKYYSKKKKGRMVSNAPGSMACMPQDLIMKHYPMRPNAATEGWDDTITGIDMQMRADMKGQKGPNSSKY